jgi:hypothetical protein
MEILFEQKKIPSLCLRCEDIFFAEFFLENFLEYYENKKASKIFNSNDFFSTGYDGELKIEEVRRILEFSYLGKDNLKKKYILIKRIERANNISENGLLKILEEPPEDTVIIVLCKKYDNLLPTIKSRLLKIEIPVDFNIVDKEKSFCPEILWISKRNFLFFSLIKEIGYNEINEFFLESRAISFQELSNNYSDSCSKIAQNEKNYKKNKLDPILTKEIYSFLIAEKITESILSNIQTEYLKICFDSSTSYSVFGSSGLFYSIWFKGILEKFQQLIYEIILMDKTASWKNILYPEIKLKKIKKNLELNFYELKEFFQWVEKIKNFEQMIINPELTFFCLDNKIRKLNH